MMKTSLRKQMGLTLLESLAILLVVGLLLGYLGPKFFSQKDASKDKIALAQMKSIAAALDHFHRDEQRYPTAEEGLAILVERLANDDSGWKGPYLEKPVLNDPWGNPYVYQLQGKGYDLVSLGADGKPDGSGEDADIHY